MGSQFLQEDAVGNSVKGLTKVQVNNIHVMTFIPESGGNWLMLLPSQSPSCLKGHGSQAKSMETGGRETLCPFKAIAPCPIATSPAENIFRIFPIGPLQVLKGCYKVSPQPSLLQAKQPQLSQPFLITEVLQLSDHLCGPPLDLLQQLRVLLVLGTPELDTGLQVGSHQSGVEGQNHLPRPAGHASLDAAQDTVGRLGCECTLVAHVKFFIYQYPQILLLRAALNPFISHPVLIVETAPTQMRDLALGLVEPHEVHMGPLLKLVQVPLDGILSFWCVSCTTQLGVTCKLAEGALDLAKSLMKTLNGTGPSTDPCGTPLVTGIHLDIEPLITTLWLRPSNQFLSHQTVHPSNPYFSSLERRM